MDVQNKIVLTGVKPTGTVHIGNYVGAIKPAIALGREVIANGGHYVMFIADYHAVNYLKNPEEMQLFTRKLACTYLACGLDPNQMIFYRQSDVPEVFEMTTLLTNFTPKGFMNKAHAYKAAVDKNIAKGEPADAGINMGLYNYPILMAADILTYGSDYVPVGKDQVQHVEITADIAGAVNACYGKQVLKIPQAITQENAALLPGTDGRKMSKSYNNVIPLFDDAEVIRKAVMSIKTDSQDINAPKNPEDILLFQIARGFCQPELVKEIEEGLRKGGMGYGTIKKMLADAITAELAPLYEKYVDYMAHYDKVEEMLREGAKKARALARPVLDNFRATVLNLK
ncbi:MAG: tryptophan--tRNA ligase [Alphaproteobacteria bacterium]|nr:tryptophan--tRNA ligase [Alphaproteobacteria bacterium]